MCKYCILGKPYHHFFLVKFCTLHSTNGPYLLQGLYIIMGYMFCFHDQTNNFHSYKKQLLIYFNFGYD